MNDQNLPPSHFSESFLDALVYATRLHNHQSRKATHIPYLSHLLAVTAMVIEWGGDEDQAVAALLHDSVEDQGGIERLYEIRDRYGERVARLVEACSDTLVTPKPPWKERKESYITKLPNQPSEVRLISLADKLHNARSIYMDLLLHGDAIMDRFKGGKNGTLWYYRSLVQAFRELGENQVAVEEFARVVADIERLAGE